MLWHVTVSATALPVPLRIRGSIRCSRPAAADAPRSRRTPPVAFAGGDDDDLDAASQAFGKPEDAAAAQPLPSGNRVFNFLRASWAELQRVQWPDRQQVAQATGVVLGFVVVTGIFLGIADYLAGKLINFII